MKTRTAEVPRIDLASALRIGVESKEQLDGVGYFLKSSVLVSFGKALCKIIAHCFTRNKCKGGPPTLCSGISLKRLTISGSTASLAFLTGSGSLSGSLAIEPCRPLERLFSLGERDRDHLDLE